VVAEASDLDGAHRYARRHPPHVLVLDPNMPGGSTLEKIPEIRAECPDTQIVVLTMQSEPAYARQALSEGAAGVCAQGRGRIRAGRGRTARRDG
jgi:two-component system, NarL family, response regulator NreC